MKLWRGHICVRVVTLTAALMLAAPAPAALAVKASVDPSSPLGAKQSESARLRQQGSQLASDLANQAADYQLLIDQIASARVEVSRNASELAGLEATYAIAQERFNQRVVVMYKESGEDWVTTVLASDSIEDFIRRAELLVQVGESDVEAVRDAADARARADRLREYLEGRQQLLLDQQAEADKARTAIEAMIAANKAKSGQVAGEIVRLVEEQKRLAAAATAFSANGSVPGRAFVPDTVITDKNYTDSTAMSAAQIQAFLDRQPGMLKDYATKDHTGALKTTAQMIAEACAAWKVSPKVVLTTLQKEQSLIENDSPSPNALDWAMGAGKTDSRTYWNMQGFGNQIWIGTQKLASNRNYWTPSVTEDIDGTAVHPSNPSTHALYRYTPHFNGVTSFWTLYWRYFGDPLAP